MQPTTPGSSVILKGNGSTVFFVNSSSTATILGLTIEGGSGTASANGGGIEDTGTLTVEDSTISGITASGNGGAIYGVSDATITVEGSTISGNDAYYGGAALFNYGTSIVEDSTISGNTVTVGLGGGAILNEGGTLTVEDSTISATPPVAPCPVAASSAPARRLSRTPPSRATQPPLAAASRTMGGR